MDQAERVKRIIVEQLGVDDDRATDDARLVDDLDADSLDVVELVMRLEEEFNLDIADEQCDKLFAGGTVGDVTGLVGQLTPA